MTNTIWTSDAVISAVLQGNSNLEIVLSNYFKEFVARLTNSEISIQNVNSVEELDKRVLEGIDQLEVLRKELLSVVSIFAGSKNDILVKHLPLLLEKMLRAYEQKGIRLYSGTSIDVLKNDHFRFFNQSLLITLTALLVENNCFDALAAILHKKFNIYDSNYNIVRQVNYIRFRSYNYTLNEHINTFSPKRISVTADYVLKYSNKEDAYSLIKADILLYYISLKYHTDDLLDSEWYPELSVFNRTNEILPHMVSKSYFEQAKVLFGVKTIEEYKQFLDNVSDSANRAGLFRIPSIKVGLLYDTVGSKE